MDMAIEMANVAGFDKRRKEARKHGKLRGLGLSNTIERAARNATTRSTPSSVSFCTTSSGLSAFVNANAIVIGGSGIGSSNTSPEISSWAVAR